MNTAEYSEIQQNRERIYIVGFRNKKEYEYEKFNFPEKSSKRLNWKNLLDTNIDDNFLYYDERIKCFPLLKEGMQKYQYRRVYVRENKTGCPTLTANMSTVGHNLPLIIEKNSDLKVSPKECFAVQGFPNIYKLPHLSKSSLYKQARVPVIEKIAEKLVSLYHLALIMDNKKWIINLTDIEGAIFRTMNGNADEMLSYKSRIFMFTS